MSVRLPQTCGLGFTLLNEARAKGMVELVKARGLLKEPVPVCQGTGVVIAGGGRYLDWAWVVCRWLRFLGCELPIQVWYLGQSEMPESAVPKFAALDVETVDAFKVRAQFPHSDLNGWTLKVFAVMRCQWRNVLFLDADCFPSRNPAEIFLIREVQNVGSLFFSDIKRCRASNWAYSFCGIKVPEKEWESGQFIVDKERAWGGLRMVNWMNEHRRFWFKLVYGDKGSLELGFRTTDTPHLISTECHWRGWGIEHWFGGSEWFRHAMGWKRGESGPPFDVLSGMFEEFRNPMFNVARIGFADRESNTVADVVPAGPLVSVPISEPVVR